MNNAFFPTRIPRFDHLSLCSTLQSCVIFLISWRSFLAGNDFGLALNATYDYVSTLDLLSERLLTYLPGHRWRWDCWPGSRVPVGRRRHEERSSH